MQLRSIEGMIYFLGEIVRYQDHNKCLINLVGRGDAGLKKQNPKMCVYDGKNVKSQTKLGATLIDIGVGAPPKDGVSVQTETETYWISAAGSDSRSLTTLNFLTQLIVLNQTREELQGPAITNIFAN